MRENRPLWDQVTEAMLVALCRRGDHSWLPQVALDLLAEHGTWLHTPEFRASTRIDDTTAVIDWPAFAAALPGFPWEPYTPSETTVARIAASIASPHVEINAQEMALLTNNDQALVTRALSRLQPQRGTSSTRRG